MRKEQSECGNWIAFQKVRRKALRPPITYEPVRLGELLPSVELTVDSIKGRFGHSKVTLVDLNSEKELLFCVEHQVKDERNERD
jgi:hypothetical protein